MAGAGPAGRTTGSGPAGPRSGCSAGAARADPRHAEAPPVPGPAHRRSQDSIPAARPPRLGRPARVAAGARACREPRRTCARHAWDQAWGRPWRTGRPDACRPGATPPPRPVAARWYPAAAHPRPAAAGSPHAAARVRPPSAAARPPAAAAPRATRRSRPRGGRCAPATPPGQQHSGRRPNPPPPSTQDPEATTSPSTVKDPLSQYA
jgi:translation initiation factor IF-2